MNPETEQPVDFRPVAEPGWRATFAHRDDHGEITSSTIPLAGWLITAEIDPETGAETGWRATYAAICDDDGEVHPAGGIGAPAEGSTVIVRGPGEDHPTVDELTASIDDKARLLDLLRRKGAA